MLLDLDYQKFEIPGTDSSIMIKALNVEAYQSLLGVVAKMDMQGDEIQSGLAQLSSPEMLAIAKEIIPNYTKDLVGIQLKENGETRNATTEDLLKIGGLLQITVSIIMRIFEISGISSEEEKQVKK